MWAIHLRVPLCGCIVGYRRLDGSSVLLVPTLHACRNGKNERVHLGALGLLPAHQQDFREETKRHATDAEDRQLVISLANQFTLFAQ